jgi:crotonobetainyl-CoA:carnitine CoA-transferase CaiB-like acyl-CoA transferase
MPPLPLSPYTVLDLTTGRSGPTAVRQLADWGARAIHIEAPSSNMPQINSHRLDGDFQNLHRNKESITLDLKSSEGHEIFMRLVDRADVLIENYRPGVTKRLGIGWDDVHARNPQIVYGSISGFGQTGPYANRPGFDQIAQGFSGLMSVTGLPGQGPVRAGTAVADSSSGLYLACGVLTALLERERTGVGRWVRTSLLESIIALMDFQAARWLVDGVCPGQEGNNHPTIAPMGVFPASDGLFNLAPAGGEMFRKFCDALGVPDLPERPEFSDLRSRAENRGALNVLIAERTRLRTVAEWIVILNEAGIPCGPILSVSEMWNDEQVRHLELAQTVDHPDLDTVTLVGQPLTFADDPDERGVHTASAPRGAHTDSVLHELGYDDDEIAALHARGVL